MKTKLFIWGMWFLFSPYLARAQSTIKGFVKDGSNSHLPAVNILAMDKDSSILAYTSTNSEGFFTIKLTRITDSLWVVAQRMGYESKYYKVYPSSTNQVAFTLLETGISLKETIIRKTSAIKTNKDTTTFAVNEFTDGSQRTVEDVLRKLPGLDVNENGSVTFKGKPIDKITLEGEDFFSKNYKVLTKNLPAFSLSKVEAIENHNDNPLLKHITRSDKTILNLVLTPNAKVRPFGQTSLGIGIEDKYEFSNSLFSIHSKLKFGQLSSANNTGNDPVAEVNYSLQNKENDEFRDLEVIPTTLWVNEFVAQPPLIPNRYITNKAKLFALQCTKKIIDSLKISAWVYGYIDKQTQSVQTRNTYLLIDTLYTIIEDNYLQKRPSLLKGNISIDYTTRNNLLIRWKTSADLFRQSHQFNSDMSVHNIYFNVATNSLAKINNLNSSLEITWKISPTLLYPAKIVG